MPTFKQLIREGKRAKEWDKGTIIKYNDKYYWLDNKKEKVVMKGNFI
ncbi:MAG: hypothetical protein ACLFQ8_00745 [Candidatus Aenigmatarchaeota archaeon]